jgi:ribosomal protein S15P/S13E
MGKEPVALQPSGQPPSGQPQEQEATPGQILLFFKNHWKEIVSVGSALISSVAGIVFWAMAYFATAKQVTRLDCLTSASILVHSKPTEIDLVKTLLASKRIDADRLQKRIQAQYDADIAAQVSNLTNEMNDLQEHLKTAKAEYEDANKKQIACLREETTTAK